MAVAVVMAVHTLLSNSSTHYSLQIKWPNDVYYRRERKIGGVLLSYTLRDGYYTCSVCEYKELTGIDKWDNGWMYML